MQMRVLGPLSVVDDDGRERVPSAPKQKQVLGLLLLNANRVVSVSTLVEELWDGGPPAGSVAVIHTYMRQLRRVMRCRLTTREGGYHLGVRSAELDVAVFENELRVAALEQAHGKDEPAAQRLRVALNGWRAPVLADVLTGPVLRQATTAIERRHWGALITRCRAELRLGLHRELIGELSALAQRYPADEEVAMLLMLALYRAGRRADALVSFHQLRAALREDHRVSPSLRLHQLYGDILSGVLSWADPLSAPDLVNHFAPRPSGGGHAGDARPARGEPAGSLFQMSLFIGS
jgi:DNA-binding SARP family transcriptional activator